MTKLQEKTVNITISTMNEDSCMYWYMNICKKVSADSDSLMLNNFQ